MRKSIFLHAILLIAVLNSISLFSQNTKELSRYYFHHLSIKDGLSQNTVNAILQDRKGFMWFGTKDGLNRYDGLSFKVFRHIPDNPLTLGNNFVMALYEDKAGNIWVGTDAGIYIYNSETEVFKPFMCASREGIKIEKAVSSIKEDDKGTIWMTVKAQGIFAYEPDENTLQSYIIKELIPVTSNVESFAIDRNGIAWLGMWGDGLYYSDDKLKSFKPYISANGEEIFKGDIVSKIVLGPNNCLYIGSVTRGVKEISLLSGRIRDLLTNDEEGKHVYFRDFTFYSDEEVWIGTESGVFIYNLKSETYKHVKSSVNDLYSLSDNAIYSLYKDREGSVWIGSYFGGLNYYPKQYTYFEKYYPDCMDNGLRGRRIREFCMDNAGKLWIGTEDAGLHYFDPKTKTISFFNPSQSFTNIHALCMDGENLWVGTFSKGLKVINTKTGTIKSYYKGETNNSLNDNSIFSIYKTSSGDIWLGTLLGLHFYNREKDEFIRVPELRGRFIYDIKEDSEGNVWLATHAHGAYRLDKETNQWSNYQHNKLNKKSVPSNKVLSIFEDSRKQIWITTQGGGFCKYNREEDNFSTYNMLNGLPNDVIYQIVEDNLGFFWLTTNKGLVCFNTHTAEIKVFTTANGLLSDQFNYRSSYKDSDGNIYFGSIDGFVVFNPHSFSENKTVPEIVITDFQINNASVNIGDEDSPLQKSIIFTDSVTLSYNQNSFSLKVNALSYLGPETNKMMYKLQGFDSEWLPVLESNLITYSNLQSGNYLLRIKNVEDKGQEGKERLLYIAVKPPFYKSGWAYLLYFVFISACIWYIVEYYKRRAAYRNRRQLEKFEQQKQHEIYNAKINFFTNIAHEIRTPLTLIKGPLESILKKDIASDIREELGIMGQNTNRLLDLANQLLDFRKTEREGFRLNFIECNISEVLKGIYARFAPIALQKELKFTMESLPNTFCAHIDKEAFTKIISNLFNNAIKYSLSYVNISLMLPPHEEEGFFTIQVLNDGVIVPKEYREEIFKPFVQYNEDESNNITSGTGIGLALSRSLAELHQGSLSMDDSLQHNCFRLRLPIVHDNAISFTYASTENHLSETHNLMVEKPEKENNPVILIVEDNPEMMNFVVKQLSPYYTVLSATNGSKALEILEQQNVSLVVSDIVMPVMDGFELCKTIKSDINYSHVPVILLTAKTTMQSKIEGLELGADAYIDKPFSVEYLLANITSLIQNRIKLRETFANSPFVKSDTMAISKADQDFLRRLEKVIQENMCNPEFAMEDMADFMNMSRSSFYRKIKGIIDLTPNEYLRIERLKKAAQLLKEEEVRVNEVCYMVGFSSPSYFAKCFYKQFGVLPKNFAEAK